MSDMRLKSGPAPADSKTTISDDLANRPLDLAKRGFTAPCLRQTTGFTGDSRFNVFPAFAPPRRGISQSDSRLAAFRVA